MVYRTTRSYNASIIESEHKNRDTFTSIKSEQSIAVRREGSNINKTQSKNVKPTSCKHIDIKESYNSQLE